VVGDLVALLVTMKGLPLAYNRDMQEDKPVLTDSLETWLACAGVFAKMVPAIHFDREEMREALQDGFVTATELADHLARRGVPFREAHAVVGKIVASLAAVGRRLDHLSLDELRKFHGAFGDDALEWIDPVRAIERRDVPGGPARRRVIQAIGEAEAELAPLG
jgi:argininosuccinate lyase